MSLFSVSRLDARVKLWLRSMDQVLLRQRGGAKARMGKLRLSLLKKTVLVSQRRGRCTTLKILSNVAIVDDTLLSSTP
jgi:hypothetical protein